MNGSHHPVTESFRLNAQVAAGLVRQYEELAGEEQRPLLPLLVWQLDTVQ